MSSEAGGVAARTPSWITALLDLAPDEHDTGVRFWRDVTGYEVSPPRGRYAEHLTLVPPDGDDFLRVQRLGEGPSRIHLDLHVGDLPGAVTRAEELGARVVERPEQGYVVLESPGGLVFCFVRGAASVRPRPVPWPGGHTSFVDQVCLDVPAARHEREGAFWEALTGLPRVEGIRTDEFSRLEDAERAALQLLLQRLGEPDGPVRAHLDLATTDLLAETARHEALGATVLDANPGGWTVLRPPAGPAYCITDRVPDLAPAGPA